ncbi:MAG: RDD family protein [Bacilli bacterium]|jgi:uncharacterized RDD family membrane protein YckC
MMNKTLGTEKVGKPAPPESRSITPAPIGRRFGSALIDAGIFVAAFFLLNLAVVSPIMNAAAHLNIRVAQMNADLENSSLYVVKYLNAAKEEIVVGYDLDLEVGDTYTPLEPQEGFDYKVASYGLYYPDSISEKAVSEYYPKMVYRFYTHYRLNRALETDVDQERDAVNQIIRNNIGTSFVSADEWYKTNVLRVDDDDSYFVSVPGIHHPEPAPKPWFPLLTSDASESVSEESSDEVTSAASEGKTIADFTFFPEGVALRSDEKAPTYDQLAAFYTRIYKAAINDLNAEPDHAHTTRLQIINLIIPFFLAGMLVYLLFPLVFPHGATLGKKALKLGVVNTYGYKALWWQHLARFFALFIFELLLTFVFYFLVPSMALLPIFVSFTLSMFGKKNRALHDFIAGTRVVDLRTSKIYLDSSEEDELNPLPQEGEKIEKATEKTVSYADRLIVPPPLPEEPEVVVAEVVEEDDLKEKSPEEKAEVIPETPIQEEDGNK